MEHEALRLLHQALAARLNPPAARNALQHLSEPGPIALRCRYHHLLDPLREHPVPLPSRSFKEWLLLVDLETRLDDALRTNSDPGHDLEELVDLDGTATWLEHVNAAQAAGDWARQQDDHLLAAALLSRAYANSRKEGYRFGQMRAAVSLGYLTMLSDSIVAAEPYFARAALLGADLNDRVFRAGALLGSAECAMRSREFDRAARYAGSALESYKSVGSAQGAGNAAERLAAAHRSRGEEGLAAAALVQALKHYDCSGSLVGIVNVCDQLGEIELRRGDVVVATAHFTHAADLAGSRYRRGRLNALLGMARVRRAQHDLEAAAVLHAELLDEYRALNDVVGLMKVWDEIGACALKGGGPIAEVKTRVAANLELEWLRASRSDHQTQTEYRQRFIGMYRATMRAAVAANDFAAALFVSESLCGRRLAGLIGDIPAAEDGQAAVADLVARADQRLLRQLPNPSRRAESVRRALDATAIRPKPAEASAERLEDLAAAFYLPAQPADAADLLADVSGSVDVLIMGLHLTQLGESCAIWRPADSSTVVLYTRTLSSEAVMLLTRIGSDGSFYPTSPDLAPLAELFPPALLSKLAATAEPARLLLVAMEDLLLVPWRGLEVAPGRTLGEAAAVTMTPSLEVHSAVKGAWQQPISGSTSIWRHPELSSHTYSGSAAFGQPALELATADDALAALTDGVGRRAVIVGHGRPVGTQTYLELAQDHLTAPIQLVTARPPALLGLICCWGMANRIEPSTDALTLAILALLRGPAQVLTTVGELADSALATRLVQDVLGADGSDLASALQRATTRLLSLPGVRAEPVAHWAPLVHLGFTN